MLKAGEFMQLKDGRTFEVVFADAEKCILFQIWKSGLSGNYCYAEIPTIISNSEHDIDERSFTRIAPITVNEKTLWKPLVKHEYSYNI